MFAHPKNLAAWLVFSVREHRGEANQQITMKNTQYDYTKKLQDPRWQRKRLEVMQAAGWKCVICGDAKEELNVHHPEYDKAYEPWQYNNLQCLCKTCHTINHLPKEKMRIHANLFFELRESQIEKHTKDLMESCDWRRRDPFQTFEQVLKIICPEEEKEVWSSIMKLQFETKIEHEELKKTVVERLEKLTAKSKKFKN